jgi:glucose/arabinose dehydrogenase
MLLASLIGVSCSAAEIDLTNANDPHAATMSGGQSITTLSQPTGSFAPDIGLQLVAEGITAPMVAVSPDDGTGRLFIVDQTGLVWILDANGTVQKEPFLDVRSKMVTLSQGYDERGLLSIAFHPDFKNNGRVFAFYSAPLRQGAPSGWNCTNHLSEFEVSSDNPNSADVNSEKVLMEIDKPQMNHNGGVIRFGPDGYLYISTGDGGGADDVGTGHTPDTGNAQDLTKILGKILRIDVDSTAAGKAYGIPADNPFLGNDSIPPEIYVYGLRNPAFMSFDRQTGTLYVGNAGQDLFESVFVIARGGNYGWHIREGTHCFDPNNPRVPPASCSATGADGKPLIGPIVELGHDVGGTVVGGYIYRGSAMPEFQGRYIFGDWSGDVGANRTLFVATPPSGWSWNVTSADDLTQSDVKMWDNMVIRVPANANQSAGAIVRGFGEDADGEIYIMASSEVGPSGTTGKVFKIVPANATAS